MNTETIKPPFVRKFSSQFPKVEVGSQPAWGIMVGGAPRPCAGCGTPTHFVEKAFNEPICSEQCIDYLEGTYSETVNSDQRDTRR